MVKIKGEKSSLGTATTDGGRRSSATKEAQKSLSARSPTRRSLMTLALATTPFSLTMATIDSSITLEDLMIEADSMIRAVLKGVDDDKRWSVSEDDHDR